jgi:hypothetical protein
VEALRRQMDTRFGLNWKRGVIGDMSRDVINYNFSNEPDIGPDGRGTTRVYSFDVIARHCDGPNPEPAVINITDPRGAGARWTLIPYIQAGLVP